jgi:hypothetical protein
MLQSCVVLGFYLCFLLFICLLGFLENVYEMFTGGDNLPGLVNYRDRFHERHVGGLLLEDWLSKASFDGYLMWTLNSFAENAVSRERFRGVLVKTQQKQNQTAKNYLCRQSSSIPLFLCAESKEERRGFEEEEVTLAAFTGERRGESANSLSRLEVFWQIGSPLVQAGQSGWA